MAILEFPIEANSEVWGFQVKNQELASPFDDVDQVVNLTGGKWRASLEFSNVVPSRMAKLRSFLMKLKGRSGSFYLTPSNYQPLGNAAVSTPGSVDGANQVGNSLVTSGWTPSLLLFREGDYIEVNGEFKMVVEDCTSNALGDATITFEPELRSSPLTNASIEVNAPRCVMRLENDEEIRWTMSIQEVFFINIDCREVV